VLTARTCVGDLPELLGDGSGAAKAPLKTKEANCLSVKNEFLSYSKSRCCVLFSRSV
jgi:hypothetical protein